MKRILMVMMIVLYCSLVPMNVLADNEDMTFAWEQPDYNAVNYWVLYWGDTSGGTYTIGSLQITKESAQESQEVPVVIEYPANAKTKYYYVLVAFKDADHFSGNSNEVFLEADFIENPSSPVQLRVFITPAP